jgi:prolyl-tRNA synthetase
MVTRLHGKKEVITINSASEKIKILLSTIHASMFEKAQNNVQKLIQVQHKLSDFGSILAKGHSVYQTSWCGNSICEDALKEYKATIRCILKKEYFSTCFYCNAPKKYDVLIAKAY